MDLRERVLVSDQETGRPILGKLEKALGREFTEEETFEILLEAYRHVDPTQAVDHLAAQLGLEKILTKEEVSRIYSYEAEVEQKDR